MTTTRKPLRVTVRLDIDVNETNWTTAYGTDGRDAIRADVESYVLNQIQQSAAAEEDAITRVRTAPTSPERRKRSSP